MEPPVTATLSAKGTRLNRRGLETRDTVLEVAVRCLAEGGPESVSANLVARRAGVTWGTVQHQFGDVDGLWAAVLEHVSRRGASLMPVSEHGGLRDRVHEIVSLMWNAYEKPAVKAIVNLRVALPRERAVLESEFPRTAAALVDWDAKWEAAVRQAFSGFDMDPVKLQRVRSMLPGAVRGLYSEQYLSSYADMEDAREGLADAITAYLS
ncbi:MAG TPA: TetR/AcrR family transcriptional regulator [Nocardioidaceae bacterium]